MFKSHNYKDLKFLTKRNIVTLISYSNFSQLERDYTKESPETIIANMRTQFYAMTNDKDCLPIQNPDQL